MEYLRVKFPNKRSVLVNGEDSGASTNQTFMLQPNTYEITLSGTGYTPAQKTVVLTGTSAKKPKTITFKSVASKVRSSDEDV